MSGPRPGIRWRHRVQTHRAMRDIDQTGCLVNQARKLRRGYRAEMVPESTSPLTRSTGASGAGRPRTLLTTEPLVADARARSTAHPLGTMRTTDPDRAMTSMVTSRCGQSASVKSILIEPEVHSAVICSGTRQ